MMLLNAFNIPSLGGIGDTEDMLPPLSNKNIYFSMSFRILIVNKNGDKTFEYVNGDDISDDCLEHVATILASMGSLHSHEPKLIFDLDAAEYAIAVSTCISYYFVSIVLANQEPAIKSVNRLISLFLALAVEQHEDEFGHVLSMDSYLSIGPSLYQDFNRELSTLWDPEETNYICFIVDENIICYMGKMPYKNEEYFEVQSDLIELSEVCTCSPFAAIASKKMYFVLPYFKHLQIGYVNNVPFDDECELIDKFKTRLSISKYTLTSCFLKSEEEEEA